MIKPEKIVKNTKKYFQTAQEDGFMNESLMNFLGEAFIKAPASTHTDFNNAFEGGLIDHILNVTKYAVIFNTGLPENERVDQKTLVKVCFLHQIGKAHLFIPCTSEWHRKNQNKAYDFNDTLTSMSVAQRSIYYLMSHGVKLTEEEYVAIINSDIKTDENKMVKYHNTTLGDLLKTAILFAIKNEKAKYNGK